MLRGGLLEERRRRKALLAKPESHTALRPFTATILSKEVYTKLGVVMHACMYA
jgi:hypothetical protein